MTGVIVGVDQDDLVRRAGVVAGKRGGGDAGSLLASVEAEWITGTVDQAASKLARLEEAGVHRVMLQHLAHEDTETVALLGAEVTPRVA